AEIYQYVTSCLQDAFETHPAARLCRTPPGDKQLWVLIGHWWKCRLFLVEFFDDACNVAGGLDVVLCCTNLAIRLHHEGRADNTLDFLAVVVLFTKRAVGREGFLLWIGQEREVEVMVFTELRQGIWFVGGDANDCNIGVIVLFHGITEVTCFRGAAWGISPWVEVHYDALSCVIGQRDVVSCIILQRDGWCGVSNFLSILISHAFYSIVK